MLFVPASARLGFDRYGSARALVDIALPHGVGADPLAIPELAMPLLREGLRARCEVVVVGDPVTATRPAPGSADRAKIDTLAGWRTSHHGVFGAVSVSVLQNPACTTTTAAPGLS